MNPIRIVAYYRVSTNKQGVSGLGLEAQAEAVESYARRFSGSIVSRFTEVESGKKCDRVELERAIAEAKKLKARLVVAKLDRIARSVKLFLRLKEAGIEIAFCDLPDIPPGPIGEFFLIMLAAVAQLEAGMIGQRTKSALQAARARGSRLGAEIPQCRNLDREGMAKGREKAARTRSKASSERLVPILSRARELRSSGLSLAQVASTIGEEGFSKPSGRAWTKADVCKLLSA